ncbi:50S ribosomal protein L30 [bacterium]|nr:50S ribosomal protein L30 [bacterium]
MGKLQIKQVRSHIGRKYDQRETLVALGITRMGLVVTHNDTPQIRGMINKIGHLLDVTEVE